MAFRTYSIGRGRDADVRLVAESVSRSHAELTITSSGRHFLTDRNSMHGTWVNKDGEWCPHGQGYVEPEQRVRFGHVETRLRDLLRGRSLDSQEGQPDYNQISVSPGGNSDSDDATT